MLVRSGGDQVGFYYGTGLNPGRHGTLRETREYSPKANSGLTRK